MTRPTRETSRYPLLLAALLLLAAAWAQSETCVVETPVTPQTEEERERSARFARYREQLAAYQAKLPSEPDPWLLMPVAGVRVAQIADTWGAPRGAGRSHEGQDIFAPLGTPIYAASEGFVYRIDTTTLGGRVVWVAGAGGRRYYYAHLEDWAEIEEGRFVTPETVLGYVGNSGNAVTTPTHLHFGVYSGSRRSCDRQVFDPLPLLLDRW